MVQTVRRISPEAATHQVDAPAGKSWLATLLGVPFTVGMGYAEAAFLWAGQAPETSALAPCRDDYFPLEIDEPEMRIAG